MITNISCCLLKKDVNVFQFTYSIHIFGLSLGLKLFNAALDLFAHSSFLCPLIFELAYIEKTCGPRSYGLPQNKVNLIKLFNEKFDSCVILEKGNSESFKV
ncbi:hypothetical protein BpHYR1_000818 [Brachionus plicatilis]|uniref:Uncharacterized protein n=1 Tax=Brachionus plicatilis TaxID=10195 RepID=A0A3M7RIV7_BRAPC|nr:hypothetical protein BpHYR1_000818 [Brachionus plicatilis]